MNTNALTKLAVSALEDLKGIDIQVIDVTSLTSVTDHLLVVTGTSSRHVKALADAVIQKALEAGVRPLSSQGLEQGEWALVDLNGVVVHALQASSRAHYQLEKLWDLGQPKPVLTEPKAKVAAKKGKPAPAKKPAAKKAAAKPAAKKAPAAKSPSKKAVAKKTVAAKPAPARKPAAGKKPR